MLKLGRIAVEFCHFQVPGVSSWVLTERDKFAVFVDFFEPTKFGRSDWDMLTRLAYCRGRCDPLWNQASAEGRSEQRNEAHLPETCTNPTTSTDTVAMTPEVKSSYDCCVLCQTNMVFCDFSSWDQAANVCSQYIVSDTKKKPATCANVVAGYFTRTKDTAALVVLSIGPCGTLKDNADQKGAGRKSPRLWR